MLFRLTGKRLGQYSGILGWLALGIILSLLLAVFPAVPARAEAELFLDPTEGKVGDRVYVTGTEFEAEEYFYLYFSNDMASIGNYIEEKLTHYKLLERNIKPNEETDPLPGEFYTQFRVPDKLDDGEDIEDVHGGEHYVYVATRIDKQIVAYATFSVPHGEIELTPEAGTVGSEIEISGQGLRRDQQITIKYDGKEVNIISGDTKTDGDGGFTSTIAVPEGPADDYIITAIDESGNRPEAEFRVTPQISVSPTSQDVDEMVEVRGTGFGVREGVIVTLDGTEIVTIPVTLHTTRVGSLGGSFVIPPRPAYTDGSLVKVRVRDESDNVAETELTVLPIPASIWLNPATSLDAPGHVGMELSASGIWFVHGATIDITYDNGETSPIAITEALDSRNFSVNFTVPPSVPGSHTVTASDGINSVAAVFTMESERPLTPVQLLPKAATTIEAEGLFDWEEVSDPSGVTYVLQVAGDSDFASVVLERGELADSEYILSEKERIRLAERQTPYYWRVKAVDGTCSESYWMISSPFYVGSPQGAPLPGWMKYLWIGVGCGLAAYFITRAWKKHAESPN